MFSNRTDEDNPADTNEENMQRQSQLSMISCKGITKKIQGSWKSLAASAILQYVQVIITLLFIS